MLDGEEWRPQGRDDVIFRKSGDDWLLYDPSTDQAVVLDRPAALVWTLCTGEHLVADIRREVETSTEAAEGDIEDIIDGFQAAGLLLE